jgi:opacity protein-like surface antigen
MKQTIFFLLLTTFYFQLTAQKLFVNTFLGASNYQGDLQDRRFSFSQAHLAFGAGLTYEVSDKFSLRAGLTIAKVSADDKKNPKVFFRNLNFSSVMLDVKFKLR